MPRPQSFSIFFPMYNERDNIVAALDQARAVLPTLGFATYEIIVVDDGSTDGSDQVVREWGRRAGLDGKLRVLRHSLNQGYGRALRSGFAAATGDVVFYTDADLPVDLQDLRKALPLLENADLVIGYRTRRQETWRRRLYSRVYNGLARSLLGVRARDINFSFKLARRKALKEINLSARSGFVDGQLLAEARRRHLRVVEMPVDDQPRRHGRSHFDNPVVALHTLSELVGYKAGPLLARAHFGLRALSFPFAALLAHLPERGLIVDVGCGHGVLARLAARERPEARVVGYDVDGSRIALARRLAGEAGLSNLRFEVADAETAPLDGAAAIACVDVMYLLSWSAQERLVARAARALPRGGRLLVKEMAARPRWKAAWNLAQETIAVKLVGLTTGDRFCFRDGDGYVALMRAHGLAPRIERLDAGYVHPHVLVRGDK